MKNKWNLKKKTALITGATKGIGLAIAEEFLNNAVGLKHLRPPEKRRRRDGERPDDELARGKPQGINRKLS